MKSFLLGIATSTALPAVSDRSNALGIDNLLNRPPSQVLATDSRIVYEGRWEFERSFFAGEQAYADWPCSTLSFGVKAASAGSLTLHWSGFLTRANATLWTSPSHGQPSKIVSTQLASGTEPPCNPLLSDCALELAMAFKSLPAVNTAIQIPAGEYIVTFRKRTQATPFGPLAAGLPFIGGLLSSGVRFSGINFTPGISISQPKQPTLHITFIGASDTAGFCVDGTPETSQPETSAFGFKFTDCDGSYSAELGRRLDAGVSVLAFAGGGLTQNALAAQGVLGTQTLPDLYDRTLQRRETPLWTSPPATDLVVVSLGGNDFNNQDGNVPSNATFTNAYISFLDRLFAGEGLGANTNMPTVLSICGQGSPDEAAFDPDNNRCRPCPFVEQAVEKFNEMRPELPAKYIFVPCDGSVVQGAAFGDIGCAGHKNRQGFNKVADFLEPQIKEIMNWK